MTEIVNHIPARLKNAAVGGHVAGAEDIIDDVKGKTQDVINAETDDTLALHQSEINALDSQNYATVGTFSELPATGSVDTIYRVSNWDGSANSGAGAVDATVYSEYAWDDSNSEYKLLDVKTAVGEVFDISLYRASGGVLAEYADLSAALDGGNNVPSGIRRGGMSVKFVQSSDSKYVRCNLLADSFTTDITQWAIDDVGVYVENPEFVYIKTDNEGKILWAIKTDGSIYYGAGVPPQVIKYVNGKIEEVTTDIASVSERVAAIETFLEGFSVETLIQYLNETYGEYIENPEFVRVSLDDENKVLEGIKTDGTKVIGSAAKIGGYIEVGGDATILGDITVNGIPCKLVENSEWVRVIVDEEGKVLCGIKTDGRFYADIASIPFEVKEILDTLDSLFQVIDNPEYIAVETDSEGKVLSGRTSDGNKIENLDLTVKGKVSVGGLKVGDTDITDNIDAIDSVSVIEDVEKRIEIKTDLDGKILSYRDSEGVLHENVGIVSKNIETENLELNERIVRNLRGELESLEDPIKKYDLPDKGEVNILQETFYLTSNEGYSDKTGIYPIQVYENNEENALALRTCVVFYVKNTLRNNGDGTYSLYNDGVEGHDVALDFYAASKVTKVNGIYYVTATLEEGQPVISSIEVTKIVDVPNVLAWTVDKETEHWCTVSIDFGDYFSGTYNVGIKFQGASTLKRPKKNFRFTFYKNNKFEKKLKIKIGEFVRLSGFNLKAFYSDTTKLKEYTLNRIFMAMWEKRRGIHNAYPWVECEEYYTGATGMIKSFPCKVSIGREFYGLDIFGLKKDEKNYLLDGDDDASGIFISCEANQYSLINGRGWADEMGADDRTLAYPDLGDDSVSVETDEALTQFLDFLKGQLYSDEDGNTYSFRKLTDMDGVYYVTSTLTDNGDNTYSINENSIPTPILVKVNKENAKERMFVLSWIDYLIGIELFCLPDNGLHNMILYTGRDKKRFYPFLYDLDFSFDMNQNIDMLSYWDPAVNVSNDTLWGPLYNLYRDEINERFKELTKTVLTKKYVSNILDFVYSNIPQEWFDMERTKWGKSITSLYSNLEYLDYRKNWLENNIFSIQN